MGNISKAEKAARAAAASSLSTDAPASLATAPVSVIETAAIAGLSTSQVASLTTDQVGALSSSELKPIDPEAERQAEQARIAEHRARDEAEALAKLADNVDNSHLIAVTKDGEELSVHPTALTQHLQLGWRQIQA